MTHFPHKAHTIELYACIMDVPTYSTAVLKNIIALSPPMTIFPSQKARLDSAGPPGVLIIHEYLTAEACAHIRGYADLQSVTEENSCPIDGMVFPILSIFSDIFCNRLAHFYKADFEWYERPQLLVTPTGYESASHSDSEQSELGGEWQRTASRDYTVVLFLQDNIKGGEIHFRHQDVAITPQDGTLVAFPSDHRFEYSRSLISSGTNYELISWGAAMNTPRPTAKPNTAMYLRSQYALSQFGSNKI